MNKFDKLLNKDKIKFRHTKAKEFMISRLIKEAKESPTKRCNDISFVF